MNIDWGKIEGYREDMTADEKLELLGSYEMPAPEPAAPTEKDKGNESNWKKQFDKVSSELAAAKKQLRSRMSEEEAKEEERKTNEEAMRTELEALRKEKMLSQYKAEHLSQGFDDKLATEAAEALADNDMDAYFRIQRKQTEAMQKAMRAQILKETPAPPAGDEANAEQAKKKKEMDQLRKWMGL